MKDIKVVELFAGVGGFRIGLEKASSKFRTIWSNQWEPGKTKQYAYDCYVQHFGGTFLDNTNEDIAEAKINCPSCDLLVGGFPCQDYSVARTGAKGIEGKKGVLWWHIRDIIETKKPKYVLLENVDRLLKSPSKQRGRDFGIILHCLYLLGYSVEWRVINAAEYGYPQRRRRIFIFATKQGTPHYSFLKKSVENSPRDILFKTGFFADEFKVKKSEQVIYEYSIKEKINGAAYIDLVDFSDVFKAEFENTGFMFNGEVYTAKTTPYNHKQITLNDILEKNDVDKRFFLGENLGKWQYLKGAKRIERTSSNGHTYTFSEGAISFPDAGDKPARTMLTSESSVNRSTHVVEDLKTGELRLLTPIETERLNGFPDNWTNTGMPEKFRYFVMGNALVVPLVTRMGKSLLRILKKE